MLNQLCVSTRGVVTCIGHLQVEEDCRWICPDGSHVRAIRSPVTQAYEQAMSLKSFLEHKVRQKGFFDQVELDMMVPAQRRRLAEFLTLKHRPGLVHGPGGTAGRFTGGG